MFPKRLLIARDGLKQRGTAKAAQALRQQNHCEDVPTRDWKHPGRGSHPVWLCFPAGKPVPGFIGHLCPVPGNLLAAAAGPGGLGWRIYLCNRGRETGEKGKEATC